MDANTQFNKKRTRLVLCALLFPWSIWIVFFTTIYWQTLWTDSQNDYLGVALVKIYTAYFLIIYSSILTLINRHYLRYELNTQKRVRVALLSGLVLVGAIILAVFPFQAAYIVICPISSSTIVQAKCITKRAPSLCKPELCNQIADERLRSRCFDKVEQRVDLEDASRFALCISLGNKSAEERCHTEHNFTYKYKTDDSKCSPEVLLQTPASRFPGLFDEEDLLPEFRKMESSSESLRKEDFRKEDMEDFIEKYGDLSPSYIPTGVKLIQKAIGESSYLNLELKYSCPEYTHISRTPEFTITMRPSEIFGQDWLEKKIEYADKRYQNPILQPKEPFILIENRTEVDMAGSKGIVYETTRGTNDWQESYITIYWSQSSLHMHLSAQHCELSTEEIIKMAQSIK